MSRPVIRIAPNLSRPAAGSSSPSPAAAFLVATITDVKVQAFETADQAADSAIAMLQDGERLITWRQGP
jgi:hypothetical protein